ncbi:MAG TPA: ABC transporter permease [Bacteroidales bacterium]|nr:ABC transporter permease [Bacteroidales bacterium]
MLKHFIKLTFRNIFRNKLYAGINILGLILSLSSAFIIILYLKTELSYDNFHKNRKQIYRVITKNKDFGTLSPCTPFYAAEFFTSQIPEIKNKCRVQNIAADIRQNNELMPEANFICADNSVFDIFSFRILTGNPALLLKDANSVVLTKSKALKYFNSLDIVGKELLINKNGKDVCLTVTGVVGDLPVNSSLQIDFLTNISLLEKLFGANIKSINLRDFAILNTFVLLHNQSSRKAVEEKMNNILSSIKDIDYTCQLQPLPEMYLHSSQLINNFFYQNGNRLAIIIYLVVLLVLLISGSANYIILSTARATKRIKEAGIRKVFGSNQTYLFIQLISDSLIEALIAFPFAFSIYINLSFHCESIFGKRLIDSLQWQVFAIILITTLIVGVLSGVIISRKISKYKTAEIVLSVPDTVLKRSFLAKILIGVQLVLFIGLIQFTSIIKRQSDYFRNKDLGFDRENLLIVKRQDFISDDKFRAIKEEIFKNPGVLGVSAAMVLPPTSSRLIQKVKCYDDPEKKIDLELLSVERDFIKTFGIKIIAGSDFSSVNSSRSIIMTKSALKSLGLFSDELGKQVDFMYDKFTIIGITEDIHIHSLHNKIIPAVIKIDENTLKDIAVRVDKHNIKATLENIKKSILNIKADDKIDIKFFNQLNDQNYVTELRLGNVVLAFTAVSTIIAALGLIGLALFISKQRTKEIGIRKVLGATSLTISIMFFKEFIPLLLISNVFAVPLGLFLSKTWLKSFAYKAPIQISMFLIIGLLSCFIVLISIGFQILKSSHANPVESLKYE